MPKLNKNTKRIVFVALVVLGIVTGAALFMLTRSENGGQTSKQNEGQQTEQKKDVERSMASMCQYLHDHDEPSGDRATVDYYKELEARAPADIHPQITTLRKGYEEIVKRPQDRLQISMDINDAGTEYVSWWVKNCQ